MGVGPSRTLEKGAKLTRNPRRQERIKLQISAFILPCKVHKIKVSSFKKKKTIPQENLRLSFCTKTNLQCGGETGRADCRS